MGDIDGLEGLGGIEGVDIIEVSILQDEVGGTGEICEVGEHIGVNGIQLVE